MNYRDIEWAKDQYQIGSQHMTCFKREPKLAQEFHLPSNNPNDYDHVYGEKKLYNWLKKNGLFCQASFWHPLKEQDNTSLPLHQAILKGDRQQIDTCLARGNDIDETDSTGSTALHLAIRKKDFELSQLLLNHGAKIDLSDEQQQTSLNEAAIHDTQGQFLQTLIENHANINPTSYTLKPPLCSAIEAKNLKAIEILIKAGAKISAQNYKDLEKEIFFPLHKQGIIPLEQKENGSLASLYQWIQKGHCVVLHSNSEQAIMYQDPKVLNKAPQLIYVNINPDSHLLDEEEWPAFLKASGYKYCPYDEEKVKEGKFVKITHFSIG